MARNQRTLMKSKNQIPFQGFDVPKREQRNADSILINNGITMPNKVSPENPHLKWQRESGWAFFNLIGSNVGLFLSVLSLLLFWLPIQERIVVAAIFLVCAISLRFNCWVITLLSNLRWLSAQQLEYQINTHNLLYLQNQRYEAQVREHESINDA